VSETPAGTICNPFRSIAGPLVLIDQSLSQFDANRIVDVEHRHRGTAGLGAADEQCANLRAPRARVEIAPQHLHRLPHRRKNGLEDLIGRSASLFPSTT